MDINRAKEILSVLAEGIDPTTGEILSDDSVYNKGDIVRALYTVLNYLDTDKTKRNFAIKHKAMFDEEGYSQWCDMLIAQTDYVKDSFEQFKEKMARYIYVCRK